MKTVILKKSSRRMPPPKKLTVKVTVKDAYQEFLLAKIPRAELRGFEPLSPAHPCLKEHQRDIANWMVRGGQRACFMAFGLGKTRVNLQCAKWVAEANPQKKYLIICPLGVKHEFVSVQGPDMGVEFVYCTNDAEVNAAGQFIITNYERVRDGGIKIDDRFAGVGLDEASVLRSFGSKTYQTFLGLFKAVKYRFVFTATPSPNKHKELIHYGAFLGVMDSGDALTRFFKRDSTQANNLTLYPHMEEQFWLWLSSWAVFMQKPSDLGYSDEGYDLPPLKVHWHCVAVDHKKAWQMMDNWGQRALFLDRSSGLKEVADVKRDTIVTRLSKAKEIIADNSGRNFILWHDLELERHYIEKAFPDRDKLKTVYGSMPLDAREEIVIGFGDGEFQGLGTKASLTGSGCNFQRHCSMSIFLGSTWKFNDFIQAVHRVYRFLQKEQVDIHVIYSEQEQPAIDTLKTKWAQHNVLVAKMAALLQKHKLSLKPDMQLKRTLNCERVEVEGKQKCFRAINNDSVIEFAKWPDNCVDEIVTSIPFGNQYEYSPSVNDMGHNPNNDAFFKQMEFLVPNLLRVLKPGRVACIHTKDRIRFGNVTGAGWPTVDAFSDETRALFVKCGFEFGGRIVIDTDVVRENNQTYRLGWTEACKDMTKMGCGMNEYVLLFRKPQTDRDRGYADIPVSHDKESYSRGQWQIDAAGLWKSDGNRLPDPELLLNMGMDSIGRLWKKHAKEKGYSYREHIKVSEALDKLGKLPASFCLFPPISNHPNIWSDIIRMRTLNSEQSRRGEEKHICPLQLDLVERLINRFSNPGEIICDPFLGIGTVAYQAVHMGRIGWGVELSAEYWHCAVGYCEQAELQRSAPTLFDMEEFGAKVIAN